MLRVRVEPAMVRRLRAASAGRSLHEMANEALNRYLASAEATSAANQPQSAGAYADPDAPDSRGGAR